MIKFFMEKHSFITIYLVVIGLFFSLSCSHDRKHKKFNIILISIDTLRADHLHIYGYKHKTSPYIDMFAKEAILFEHAYCPIPKTSASFASLMTGLHPFVHKTRPNCDMLKLEYITIAEALRMGGYYNFAVVDNPNLSKKYKFNQGFNEYIEVWNEIKHKKESSHFITSKVLDFLKENGKRPFFLWVNYMEPHTPYMPPEKFIKKISKGRNIKKLGKKMFYGSEHERKLLKKFPYEGHFISLYDGAVRYVDSEIGKILDFVREHNLYKDSIIIILSDHGEELGEHNYFFNHGPLTFNSSSRIPLIIHIPEQKSRKIKYPVSLMDIYPTILDSTGLSLPYEIQGKNLFKKEEKRFLSIIGADLRFKQVGTFSVVYKDYHYIRVLPWLSAKLNLGSDYLFNICKDPYELNNIGFINKKLIKIMKNKYKKFYNKYGYYYKMDELKKKNIPLSEKEIENLKTLGYIE